MFKHKHVTIKFDAIHDVSPIKVYVSYKEGESEDHIRRRAIWKLESLLNGELK